MKLSFSSWAAIVLLVICIGEGIYIYATRPVKTPEYDKIISDNKAKDSIIENRNHQIVLINTRLVISEMDADNLKKQRAGLSLALGDAGNIIENLSDSLNIYKKIKDTPHLVMACDTLQKIADSMVVRNRQLDSVSRSEDHAWFIIGLQKDSVNDLLHQQLTILKSHDSLAVSMLLASERKNDKQQKTSKFWLRVSIIGGVAVAITEAVFLGK